MSLSVPQYFNEYTSVAGFGHVRTQSRWFNDSVNVLLLVAGFVAYLLDNTFHMHGSSVASNSSNMRLVWEQES
jgi:solute carrier family 23 (nucleobase transporter), member 1